MHTSDVHFQRARMEGSSVESALPDAPMVDEAAALPDALSNVDLTASSMSASRPSSRFAVARAALVTKTVRSWSRDDSYKENNDQANEPSAEDDPSQLIAESLILKGLKRRPTRSQTAADFYNSITHLHLDGQGLTGDVECLSVCPNLQVLYLYDNKLTSLRGLGGLKKLTHLYAQNNDIESLDDFTAPPNLQQLFLNGNLLVEVRGLQETRCLAELHLAGQRRSLPPPPPPAATEWALGAPPPPPPPERPRPAPIRFEQDSLFAIAPTLRKLDVSACHLDDDAVELFIVFQELEHLEMPRNCLEHVDRLQQLVSRLPQLRLLKLAGNPLVSKAKFRERVILATPYAHGRQHTHTTQTRSTAR